MKIRHLKYPSLVICFLFLFPEQSKLYETMSSAELQLALNKLSVLGSVLYIAAHPDDENTAFLAYLSNERMVRTGYLSITRGGGGQNLIGSEKSDMLGLLRTNELLAARSIDGAEQFFTRAIDFGYSKSPEESMEIWGQKEILSDVVWIIRKFQPDVIISRFSRTQGGHGHHLASAILAEEAFKAAGDPSKFTNQLKYVKIWQPKRIFWNAWRPNATDASKLSKVDLGTYNTLLGESYNEISARSRTMHKSQGFGSRPRRGSSLNHLQLISGEPVKDDMFDNVDLSWNRVPGGSQIAGLLKKAQDNFNPENPSEILPILFQVLDKINSLPESYWITLKKEELLTVIKSCSGFWIEASATDYSASPDDKINLNISIVNRSKTSFNLDKIELPFQGDSSISIMLQNNVPVTFQTSLRLPQKLNYSHPFWLEKPSKKGRYVVTDQNLIGTPTNREALFVKFTLSHKSKKIIYNVPVIYRWVSRVDGELRRPFEIAPKVTVNFENNVLVFPNDEPKKIQLKLKSFSQSVKGTLILKNPPGWKIEPAKIDFTMENKYEEKALQFIIHPSKKAEIKNLVAEVAINGTTISRGLEHIEYKHIPIQTLFPTSQAKLVKLDMKIKGNNLGYIMGSGDDIPDMLQQVGYKITILSDLEIVQTDLSKFDAIIIGVRAFNTRPKLSQLNRNLIEYVHQGGTLVAQYNVSRGLVTQDLGPYTFSISRDRVTVEEATINFLNPNHSLLNFPNKISATDFDDWVQERGLYFANDWDTKYEPILSCHDPGESDKNGGLLYTKYGKGVYIYTGYSWFRQLPAGVPGAFRLFANMIAAGRE